MSKQLDNETLEILGRRAADFEKEIADTINRAELPGWLAVTILQKVLNDGMCGNLMEQLNAVRAFVKPDAEGIQ